MDLQLHSDAIKFSSSTLIESLYIASTRYDIKVGRDHEGDVDGAERRPFNDNLLTNWELNQ